MIGYIQGKNLVDETLRVERVRIFREKVCKNCLFKGLNEMCCIQEDRNDGTMYCTNRLDMDMFRNTEPGEGYE